MIEEQKPPLRKTPVVGSSFSGSLISEVYLMDCIEGMKHYSDNYFDLAVVDPPYGIDASNMNLGNGVGTASRTWTKKDWDLSVPQMEYFIELFRVSKNQIIWGANYFFDHLPNTKGVIIWDKIQEFSGADFELAWTSFDKVAKAFRMSRVEAYTNQLKIHPTQKPIRLYDFCFDFAKLEEGAKVIDTHLGSGSSRISANKNGLNFVGFEIDEEYFNKQEKRYADFTAQTRLW